MPTSMDLESAGKGRGFGRVVLLLVGMVSGLAGQAIAAPLAPEVRAKDAGGVPVAAPPARPVAIVGATLVGLEGSPDVSDSAVVMAGGRITAVGRRDQVRIPKGARIVGARGRYLVPGLIDAFGAMRSQAFADAYLYEGVTTVVVPRGPAGSVVDGETTIVHPERGPSVLTGRAVSGYAPDGDIRPDSSWLKGRQMRGRLDPEALRREVDDAAVAGDQVINAALDLWPDQLRAVVDEAHRRGLAVFAEPAFTTYPEAIQAGVDAFVRNDRYSMWTAGPDLFEAFSVDPFGGGARAAISAVCASTDRSPGVAAFGAALKGGPVLIPALSMEATADDVGGPNPWKLRSAAFFQPSDLDDPVDPATGARPYLQGKGDRVEHVRACARSKQAIDRGLHASGARYVAGTSTPGFGVMPGGGLHVELQLLQGVGLTPREALEAATSRAAAALRLSDRGLVAPGRRGDLVLLRKDPRRDVEALDSIEAVYAQGRLVPRASLIASARRRHRPVATPGSRS